MKKLLVLVFCLGLATAANADLIALYEFEGNFSDSTGTQPDGVPNGSPGLIVDGERGNVLSVSPGNQVDCGVVTDSSVLDMTVGLWVLTPDPIGVSNRPLTSASADYTTLPGWMLFMRNDDGWLGPNNVWFRINGEPAEGAAWDGGDLWIHTEVGGDPIFTPGEWIHLAFTFDATSRMIKGYVNGLFHTEKLVTEDTRAVGSDVESLILGGQQEAFTGLMDEVAIWNHVLTDDEVHDLYIYGPLGIVSGKAGSPDPVDGATDVCPKVVLSWTPGPYADKHDVYFGTDFDDVNDATTTVDPNNVYKGRQDPDRYPIADTLNLDFGQTYYWRIDEVNASPDFTVFEGDIWQFTIEPIAYPIAGDEITATASSSMAADQGPENTINGSGLDANDLHSTETTDMWLSGEEPPGQAWIEYEFDKVYKLHEMWVWNHNSVFEGDLGYGLKDVTIEYSENGADYTTLGTTHEFARAPGAPGYEHNTEVYFGVPAKYVRLTANSNWGGILNRYGLSEVRFFRIPVRPGEESPESGTTIDGIDVVLSWRPGREADEHNVYFSTSFEDVNTGTIAPDIIDAAGECETTYGPLSLDLGKTYYWKVNEVNLAEEPSTWQGDVWNFTTPEYLVVDDMEAYTGRQSIRAVWHDGYVATATSGSNVTVSTESDDRDPRLAGVGPPWPVRGSEAMQFAYDNDGSITLYVPGYAEYTYSANANYYSEIAASTSGPNSLEIGQDWTSAEALSLWFYGDPNNAAEEMYVKLNGSKVVYDGDAGDVQQAGWHEWTIALSDFGVDLQNVTTVYIGFGDENNTTTPGGSGVVFFDDIGLYPSRCVLSKRSPDFARVDYVEDCVVDYKEVEVMAETWLAVAVAPSTASAIAFYEFEGDLSDSTGTQPDGDPNGSPELIVDGERGNVLSVSPGNTVDCNVVTGSSVLDMTVGFWVVPGEIAVSEGPITSTSADYSTLPGWRVFLRNDAGWLGPNNVWFRILAEPAVDPNWSGGDLWIHGDDPIYTPGEWIHLAFTFDATSRMIKGYVDGLFAAERLVTEDTRAVGSDVERLTLGGQLEPFTGLLDDVLIYDVVLTDAEIAGLTGLRTDLYEDQKIDFKDFAELAAWWLDEQLCP